MSAEGSRHQQFVERAFWILLGRPVLPQELREALRSFNEASKRTLLIRLMASPEFRSRREVWSGQRQVENGDELERGLIALGSTPEFVHSAYECLLGRPSDDEGFRHYSAALAGGESRSNVVSALCASDEFQAYFCDVAPEAGVLPCDSQLCELANPAKWDNPDWLDILRSLGLSDDKLSMHRKPYEFTQLIFGCRRLGVLTTAASIVSIGAGHELILYWLANHVKEVIATDLYEGVWQEVQGREGDPAVIETPEGYAPFPYRHDRLRFMKMDGRSLAFRDGVFDIAYSLSSIEHFGGIDEAAKTIREMGRVLRPGGILALATEYVIDGPPHEETFQPDEFQSLIRQPGLELVEPLDDRVYRRYSYRPIDLYRNPYQSPHMVVRFNDTVFTSVMVFLRKH